LKKHKDKKKKTALLMKGEIKAVKTVKSVQKKTNKVMKNLNDKVVADKKDVKKLVKVIDDHTKISDKSKKTNSVDKLARLAKQLIKKKREVDRQMLVTDYNISKTRELQKAADKEVQALKESAEKAEKAAKDTAAAKKAEDEAKEEAKKAEDKAKKARAEVDEEAKKGLKAMKAMKALKALKAKIGSGKTKKGIKLKIKKG